MNKNEIYISTPRILRRARIITVSGGKGGVGKSFFAVNFAAALSLAGNKVLIFDADVNLSNVHLMTHINSNTRFDQFLKGEKKLKEIIEKGVGGIDVIYTGNDLGHLIKLDQNEINLLHKSLFGLEMSYDYIIIDTAAGLDELNINLMLLADTVIMVTTPVITAMTDLYRVIKIVSERSPGKIFDIVINQVKEAGEAADTFRKIAAVISKFKINSVPNSLGFILDRKDKVNNSIQKRVPILILDGNDDISACFKLIMKSYLKRVFRPGKYSFFNKLVEKLKN